MKDCENSAGGIYPQPPLLREVDLGLRGVIAIIGFLAIESTKGNSKIGSFLVFSKFLNSTKNEKVTTGLRQNDSITPRGDVISKNKLHRKLRYIRRDFFNKIFCKIFVEICH